MKRFKDTFEEHKSIISQAHKSKGVGKGVVVGSVYASLISVCFVSCTPQLAPLPQGTCSESSVREGLAEFDSVKVLYIHK